VGVENGREGRLPVSGLFFTGSCATAACGMHGAIEIPVGHSGNPAPLPTARAPAGITILERAKKLPCERRTKIGYPRVHHSSQKSSCGADGLQRNSGLPEFRNY
jgi:hypothetical protein